MEYIATFHTHFGATSFTRLLSKKGYKFQMMPVPRVLSASCGVCVNFDSIEDIDFSSLVDIDSVFKSENQAYECIFVLD